MTFRAMAAALVFVAAALGAGPAAAQEDNRLALSRQIMGLMQVEMQLTDFFSVMSPVLGSAIAGDLGLAPNDATRITELVVEEFHAATPGMVEEMAAVYARNMSERELQDTLSFMQTPSGGAFLRTQFEAEGELERIGQEAGMRVGLSALARFEAERNAGRPGNKT